jgi:hypothetical protein
MHEEYFTQRKKAILKGHARNILHSVKESFLRDKQRKVNQICYNLSEEGPFSYFK